MRVVAIYLLFFCIVMVSFTAFSEGWYEREESTSSDYMEVITKIAAPLKAVSAEKANVIKRLASIKSEGPGKGIDNCTDAMIIRTSPSYCSRFKGYSSDQMDSKFNDRCMGHLKT